MEVREAYLVNYFCQSGEQKAATFCLNDLEKNQLDDIIFKLLNNGVKLGISFTTVSEILSHQDVSK